MSSIQKTFAVTCLLALAGAQLAAQSPDESAPGHPATVRMTFEIDYQPFFSNREEPWDLYVYLDGDLLTWVSKGGQFAPTPPDRHTRELAPGPHLIRLLVESHEQRAHGWAHEARAAPFQLFFRLEPGGSGEVVLRFIHDQNLLKSETYPVSAMVRQNGQLLQNIDQAGSPPSLWPHLCEEVETWLDENGKGPRKVTRKLERCVRWESLWPGIENPPSRGEVRALLGRYGFMPRTYKRF